MDILNKVNSSDALSILISVSSMGYYIYNFYSGTICQIFEPPTRYIILAIILIMLISIVGIIYYIGGSEDDNNKTNSPTNQFLKMMGLDIGEGGSNKDKKFFNSLPLDKQNFYKKKEEELHNYVNNGEQITPKYRVLQTNLPLEVKNQIIKKIDNMDNTLNPFAEKDEKWIDAFLKLPIDKYAKLDDISNQKDLNKFFIKLKENLDNTLYGQEKVKSKILEIVAQWLSNPKANPPVIGLCGPPGIGKTTIIRSLAKSLNRPFSFISMGGMKDGAELKGHSQTYVGSVWGKITQILMEKKCMNPVIFLDELDKISDLNKNEINGVLMALIDGSQNTQFQDTFFHGIDLDLSKALFIFSFNDKSLINRVLLDRITTIDMEGYIEEHKINIVKDYVLKRVLENNGMKKDDITISDKNILKIIKDYCRKEPGVRDLIHKIEDIVGRINLCRLVKDDDNVLNLSYNITNVKLPLEIDDKLIQELL